MSTKFVEIVHTELHKAAKAAESSFHRVWASRGWELKSDVEARAKAEAAKLEPVVATDAEKVATEVANKVEAVVADVPAPAPVPVAAAPLGETGTGNSTQKPAK